MLIGDVRVDDHRIPLLAALSDGTQGTIRGFERWGKGTGRGDYVLVDAR